MADSMASAAAVLYCQGPIASIQDQPYMLLLIDHVFLYAMGSINWACIEAEISL